MVIAPAPQATFTLVEGLDETPRGTGGFGSTGSE
jgi:dUTP pyrophosphatase